MQKIFNQLSLTLLVFVMTCGMASCDKVNEVFANPEDVKSIDVKYSLDLSDTWYEYYDILVTYYDEFGQPQSFQATTKWEYSFSLAPKKAPANYIFTVTATPKEDHPALDVEPITLSQNIKADFVAYRNNGTIVNSGDLYPSSKDNVNARTFTSENSFYYYFRDGRRTLMDFSKSWDGKY